MECMFPCIGILKLSICLLYMKRDNKRATNCSQVSTDKEKLIFATTEGDALDEVIGAWETPQEGHNLTVVLAGKVYTHVNKQKT